MQEKYAMIPIEDLETKVEEQLFPAAFRICHRIEEEGNKEFESRLERHISTKCPLRQCAILNNEPARCPKPLCWIAEGPTWPELLLPDISAVYLMLTYSYMEALNIPDDPDEEITLREKPLNVINRRLGSANTQDFIIEAFEESQILKSRAPVIKDILWAHNKTRYTLSVPLLIIQIEGILHDLAYHFNWQFEKKEMYGRESAKVWAIVQKLDDERFETALSSFYSRKGSSEDSPRNLILHGRSLDYAKDHRLSAVLFLVLIYLITFSQMRMQGRITID